MAGPLSRFVASKSSTATNPLPPISIPKLPEKLRRIDPDGVSQWESAMESVVREQFRTLEEKLNTVIDAQKTGS
jgi:hypothetical protein